MPALITEEKGKKHLDYLIENRKRVEEERKQRELDEQKGVRQRTPVKYQQYTRSSFNPRADKNNEQKKCRTELQIAVDELNAIGNSVKNLKKYDIK